MTQSEKPPRENHVGDHPHKKEKKLSKSDRDNRFYARGMLVTMILSIALATFWPKDDPEYERFHGLLLTVSVLAVLLGIALIQVDDSFRNTLRSLKPGRFRFSSRDEANLLWFAVGVVGLIGLLLVDINTAVHSGFRIGAVMAIAFAKVAWLMFKKRR